MRFRTILLGVTITALSYLAITWWRSYTQPTIRKRGTRKPRDTWKHVQEQEEEEEMKKKRKPSTDDMTVDEDEITTTTTTTTTETNTTVIETSTTTSQIAPTTHTENPIFYDLLKLYAGVDQQPRNTSYPRGTSLSESIVSMAPLAPSVSRRSPVVAPVIPFSAHTSPVHLHPHSHTHTRPRAQLSLSDGALSSDDTPVEREESTGDESDITPLRSARLRRVRRTRVISPRHRNRGSLTSHANSLVPTSSTRVRKASRNSIIHAHNNK